MTEHVELKQLVYEVDRHIDPHRVVAIEKRIAELIGKNKAYYNGEIFFTDDFGYLRREKFSLINLEG